MKSPMVTNLDYIDEKERYSDLKVMRSAAGWYVGTSFSTEAGFDEPGTRDSGYYVHRKDAERFPAEVIGQGPEIAALMLRTHP